MARLCTQRSCAPYEVAGMDSDDESVIFDDNDEERSVIEILKEEPITTEHESTADEVKFQAKPILKRNDSIVSQIDPTSISTDVEMELPPKVKEDARVQKHDPSTTPAISFQDPKVVEVQAKGVSHEQKDEPTLAEIDKENIEPPSETPVDNSHYETIEVATRRIRDSLAIMKKAQCQ